MECLSCVRQAVVAWRQKGAADTIQQRRKAVLISEQDSVLTVLEDVASGELVDAGSEQLIALEQIPQYHKIARWELQPGEQIYKYGQPMGYATTLIRAGQWIHTHNVNSKPLEEEKTTW